MRSNKEATRRTSEGFAPPFSDRQEILTGREARRFLKIGRTKLHELTRRQHIPAYRIGSGRTSALRYLKSDLLEWLFRQKV